MDRGRGERRGEGGEGGGAGSVLPEVLERDTNEQVLLLLLLALLQRGEHQHVLEQQRVVRLLRLARLAEGRPQRRLVVDHEALLCIGEIPVS